MSDGSVATMTLTEFLLARIAEDEAAARDAGADATVRPPVHLEQVNRRAL